MKKSNISRVFDVYLCVEQNLTFTTPNNTHLKSENPQINKKINIKWKIETIETIFFSSTTCCLKLYKNYICFS